MLGALNFSPSEKHNIRPLTRHYRYWLRDRLLSYLDHENPLILNEAVHGFGRLKAKKAVERVFELHNHEFVGVRESVLRYLSDLYPERAYPVLIEALHDSRWMVRSEATDLLGLSEKWIEAVP